MAEMLEVYSDLRERFRMEHVILFAGKEVHDSKLERLIASQPWSCVFTTRVDGAFDVEFDEQRSGVCTRIETTAELGKQSLLSKDQSLAIVHIMPSEPLHDDFGFSDEKTLAQEHAAEMLRILPRIATGPATLIISGLQPGVDGEIELRHLAKVLTQCQVFEGGIQFWGVNESAPGMDQMKRMAEQKGYGWYAESLENVFCPDDSESETDNLIHFYDDDNEYFFKGGQAYPIAKSISHTGIFTLLTREEIHRSRPIGVEAIKMRYEQFLRNSAVSPQWYGYLDDSEYYVHRDFEAPMVEHINKMLDGNDKQIKTKVPFVLYGDPCTSKSVVLGAVAYQVFSRKKNPVIFINKDTFSIQEDSEHFLDLLELMQALDDVGGKQQILIVWDSAFYTEVEKNAKTLSKMLQDRGRRFVLLCSAYRTPDRQPSNEVSFDRQKEVYQLTSGRELSVDEQNELLYKIGEYYDDDIGELLYHKMEQTSDIFTIFYTLVDILQPPLKSSLSREEETVMQYVREELLKTAKENKMDALTSQLAGALVANKEKLRRIYGIDVEEKRNDEDGIAKLPYDFHHFNACIALLSQFKLKMPCELGLRLLKKQDVSDEEYRHVMHSGAIFHVLTTSIPWLHYGLNSGGTDYEFSYRNTKEAELYLERHKIDGKKQVQLLYDILDVYHRESIRNYDMPISVSFGDEQNPGYNGYSLDRLLRFMGPNSRYFPYAPEKVRIHDDILFSLETIINKLWEMYVKDEIPDECSDKVSILVTFSREYYGKIGNSKLYLYECNEDPTIHEKNLCAIRDGVSDFHLRLSRLQEIKQIASEHYNRHFDAITDGTFQPQYRHKVNVCNNLAVEMAKIESAIRRVEEMYTRFTADVRIRVKEVGDFLDEKELHLDSSLLSHERYYTTFKRMNQVIKSNPQNGYAYNALFDEFIHMYEDGNISNADKLRYLTEIKLIADDCDLDGIRNNGTDRNDELSDYLYTIEEYAAKYEVSIADVKSHTAPNDFQKLYDQLLHAGSSSGIMFVCQRELNRVGITRNLRELSSEQRTVCLQVIRFMRSSENSACVERNYSAMNLLLRTTWMYYTGRVLDGITECQPICMDHTQWGDVQEIGEQCLRLAKINQEEVVSPVIVLITALAKFQVTGESRGIQNMLNEVGLSRFSGLHRMRVPFLVCREGMPVKCSGSIEREGKGKAFLRDIHPSKEHYSFQNKIRFIDNYSSKKRVTEGRMIARDLYLGIGYTGFAVFRESWLKDRGDN